MHSFSHVYYIRNDFQFLWLFMICDLNVFIMIVTRKLNIIVFDHTYITMRRFQRPAYAYFNQGVRTTPIEARIPLTEPKSNAEFKCCFLLRGIDGLQGWLSYIGMDCFLSILENYVITLD